LAGEEVFPIEPLPLEMDAIELFAIRARAQKPDFAFERYRPLAVRRLREGPLSSGDRYRAGPVSIAARLRR